MHFRRPPHLTGRSHVGRRGGPPPARGPSVLRLLSLSALVACGGAGTSGDDDGGLAGPVSFNEHIAPILYESCTPCHRPNGPAPFSLLTYAEARSLAPLVGASTADRSMPPWLPAAGSPEFAGDRSLSESQIDLIQRWVSDGTPEGDPQNAPTPPPLGEDWPLGEPELLVTLDAPYELPGSEGEIFRNFVIPAPVNETRYVRTIDIRPSDARVVHHAQLLVDRTGSARRVDARDPEPGFDGMLHAGNIETPSGFFLGWTPGRQPFEGYDGLGWKIDAQTDLILMLHLRPGRESEPVDCDIALYFTDAVPTRFPLPIKLSAPIIDIPAGAHDYSVQDSFTLPVDVQALSVYPHAHYRGKRVEGRAVLPDGTEKLLIRIEDWDFNWQDEYRYSRPIALPRGTTLLMRWTYDNSAANPRNPARPPVRVVYGPRSADEMGELMIQVLPRSQSDRHVLTERLRRKDLEWQVALFRHKLRAGPEEPDHHYDLGVALQELGRLDEAISHYRRVIELRPDHAEAHGNLGTALRARGAPEEARLAYLRSLALEPGDPAVRTNLGSLLQSEGDLRGAIEEYREAIRIDRDYARAHGSLGFALAMKGAVREAVAHFREAIRLDPEWVAPKFGAAWALATNPDSALRDSHEAIVLAEDAAELTDYGEPTVLDVLAAAYASDGQFERAAATAERARWLALQGGQHALARDIEHRVNLYKRRRTYRTRPLSSIISEPPN